MITYQATTYWDDGCFLDTFNLEASTDTAARIEAEAHVRDDDACAEIEVIRIDFDPERKRDPRIEFVCRIEESQFGDEQATPLTTT